MYSVGEIIGPMFGAAMLSLGLSFPVWKCLKFWNIQDVPTSRSSHVIPTPRGGCVAVCGLYHAV